MSRQDFDQGDVEIITELMNIGFGAAAADLSMLIDVMVRISVPKVRVVSLSEYRQFVDDFKKEHKVLTVSSQTFLGKVSGSGILILPGEDPFYILSNVDGEVEKEQPAGEEILADLTNLMVGASISKISELLEEVVQFEESQVLCWKENGFPDTMFRNDEMHIVLEANFTMESGDHKGYLLLVTREESIPWLKKALKNFMDQFG